ADPCQNGGRWTGTGCLCPPNVDGDLCQFGAATINITAELGRSVMMSARVTNRKFSEEMRDPSSGAFRGFVEEFRRTVDGIYRNISGYGGIRVLSLARGSVVVHYQVLLRPPAGDNPHPSLDHRVLELLKATNTAAPPQNCTRSPGGKVGGGGVGEGWARTRPSGGLSSPELCQKYAPANFKRFYHPYGTGKGLLCVTNCTLNVPGSIGCAGG
ncbi:MUC3A protein, partial [Corythaixoides concolor]|nr:MUC3A protein [Corythaixoides concolor]